MRLGAALGNVPRWCGTLAFALLIAVRANDAAAIFIATEPWVRLAATGRATEAYMELTSTEGATLIGVRCAAVASIEFRAAGTSRVPIREIKLPAGEKVLLAPHANRIVLMGLKRSLQLGDRVAMILVVEAADGSQLEIPLNAEVRQRSPTDDHRLGHRH